MSQDDKHRNRIFCEIVAQLIIADAAVTDSEREFLSRLMDRFGFDEHDRSAVINAVDIGEPIDHRLAQLDAAAREQLLADLEEAAVVDGEVGAGEWQIIEEVRRALG
jgi:uncharacterized tellurite resistance protein B-like protein